jgi:hypothetical protein
VLGGQIYQPDLAHPAPAVITTLTASLSSPVMAPSPDVRHAKNASRRSAARGTGRRSRPKRPFPCDA